MIGPRPCAYACAYVNPVFTSQSYDLSIKHKNKKNNLVRFLVLMLMLMSTQFSLAYTCDYAYVDPVFTCLHMCLCLCLCLCASENQALARTSPLRLSGRTSELVNVTIGPRFDSCCDY